jgi:chitinase
VPVVVSVTPPTPTININETQQFTSGILGSTNMAVTWKVQEGATGGTVTAAGLYTAPGVAGTYHVIATSQADTTKTATTTVTVQAGSASGTIQ